MPSPTHMNSLDDRIIAALAKLKALREGDQAVLDLVACGGAAIGPLRSFLFAREPSGLFQARCQAAEALAALGAKYVLLEFLAAARTVPDPVEQTGEEAVLNTVASLLARWPEKAIFRQLLEAGRHRPLSGIVDALSAYARVEAIPIYSAALAEDFSRQAAENAFRRLGDAGCRTLLQLAGAVSADRESESRLRLRRSALKLLIELWPKQDVPRTIAALMKDRDPEIAVLACSFCLFRFQKAGRESIRRRLEQLRAKADWLLAEHIDEMLKADSAG